MTNKFVTEFFDSKGSNAYDERNKKLAPISANLHFLIRLVLKDLPQNANILCVGVGTGNEIVELARAFPGWQFTGLDPAAGMLEVCRERLQREGLSDRCELFHGYLGDFPQAKKFDAVVCLLVMHFIKDLSEREKMFRDMALRLKQNGYLVNAEIGYDTSSPQYPRMLENWKAVQTLMGGTPEAMANLQKTMSENLLVLAPSVTEDLLRRAGFPTPVAFFQAFMISAWYAQKN